ncbi:MAG: DinB family protein [Chloroflexi bacterium]|nr:DinB family protein [Chloroflexota bacterium]
MSSNSIAPFYADWAGYNRRTAGALGGLSAEDLALQVAGSDHWPIWAVAGHTVGARVFWLCHVAGEPGAETTPFADPTGLGWEDDLATVRSAAEIAGAYESTWRIVAGCLERWTPDMLGESFERQGRTTLQRHTRQSLLLRLINHEAYHVGEMSLALGAHGREPIDLWPAADWAADAPVVRREG